MTIWPAPLKLAGTTILPVFAWASWQPASTSAWAMPMMAAMAPTPTGTATCMARPRSRTVRTASAKERAPAATRAEYSPRLCPATKSGLGRRAAEGPRHHGGMGEDGRLGVLGQLEGLFGPLGHQLGELEPQGGVRLLEDGLGGGFGLGQRHAHAHGLGALSREQPCDFAHGYL